MAYVTVRIKKTKLICVASDHKASLTVKLLAKLS